MRDDAICMALLQGHMLARENKPEMSITSPGVIKAVKSSCSHLSHCQYVKE